MFKWYTTVCTVINFLCPLNKSPKEFKLYLKHILLTYNKSAKRSYREVDSGEKIRIIQKSEWIMRAAEDNLICQSKTLLLNSNGYILLSFNRESTQFKFERAFIF